MEAPRPGAARRLVVARLAVLAFAVAVGLALQGVVTARLEAIDGLSRVEPVRARGEMAALLRLAGAGVFGFTAVVGLSLLAASRRALRLEIFPPPGLWSWGAVRAITGPRARTVARVGVGLSVALVLLSLAAGSLLWYAAGRLLACGAG